MSKRKKNRNEELITQKDIEKIEFRLENFDYRERFRFLCTLHPNQVQERLEIIEAVDEKDFNIKKPALIYIFVLDGKILKIGASMTSFKGRVGSYNCGRVDNRIRGTCSTTNYFVLQSLLKLNKNIDVYAYFIPTTTHDVFGQMQVIPHNPKYWEKVILTKLKKENKLPIFCTQR